jgi:succinate dehydrogenase flavin-adding protein (antitoxin of CptAB toxin-antitoxin module)
MDLLKAVQLVAMKAVVKPDQAFLVRRIHRWYSKTFCTPLAEVEDLPLLDVLQTYFEERYQEMSEEDLAREKEQLLQTEEQQALRVQEEEAEEAESWELRRIIAETEKKEKLEAVPGPGKVTETLAPVKRSPLPVMKMKEAELPFGGPAVALPEGISMKFVDEADFEAEIQGYGSMAQPKRPQS